MGGEGRSEEAAGGAAPAEADKIDESRGASSKKASERASSEKLDRIAEKEGKKEKEKDNQKEKEKVSGGIKAAPVEKKDKLKPPPAEASRQVVRQRSESLPDDVLSMIAQAKFESQEDKLKDVARFSLALLRDYPKLSSAEVAKRVSDVQKSLLKYEMQCIRAWEYQERRRRLEITGLEEEAERCRQEAVTEGHHTVELHGVLEKERRRRKRYEGYEEAAAEVNRKRTRPDSKAAITSTTEDIAQLKQSSQDCDKLQAERTKRAHLLRSAVTELSADLVKEKEFTSKVLSDGGAGGKASAAPAAEVVDVIL